MDNRPWNMDLEISFRTFAQDLEPFIDLSTSWIIVDFLIFYCKGAFMVSSSKKKRSYVCNITMRFLIQDTMHTQGFLSDYLTMRLFISCISPLCFPCVPLPLLMYFLLAFFCLVMLVRYPLDLRIIHHFIINKQILDPTSSGIFSNKTQKHNKMRLGLYATSLKW